MKKRMARLTAVIAALLALLSACSKEPKLPGPIAGKTPYELYQAGYQKLGEASSLEAEADVSFTFRMAVETVQQRKRRKFMRACPAGGGVDAAGYMELNNADGATLTGRFWFDDGWAYYEMIEKDGDPVRFKTPMSAGEAAETLGAPLLFVESDVISSEMAWDAESGAATLTMLVGSGAVEGLIREYMDDDELMSTVQVDESTVTLRVDSAGMLVYMDFKAIGRIAGGPGGGSAEIELHNEYRVTSANQTPVVTFPEEIYGFPEETRGGGG